MAQRPHLYVLDTGVIECADFTLFSPAAAPGEHRDMTVRSYLLVHPDGLLVWDTGIADEIGDEPGGRQIDVPIRFRMPRTLRAQLEELDFPAERVDIVGMSHLHIDHVGNLDLFATASVVMQRAEYEAAHGPDPEALTYIPSAYAALDHDRVQTVEGEHDVFGDGVAVMVPLPGHTPGHQGLLVTLPETGPVFLAADVAYTSADYAAERIRTDNVDIVASADSIRTTKALERDLGAAVWLHHDREAQRSIRLAPAHYA